MSSKTFCAAPWVHACVRPTGRLTPCCQNNMSDGSMFDNLDAWWHGEMMQKLRQDLTAGIPAESCSRCWQEERAGKRSLRQIYNQEWEDLVTEEQDLPVTFDLKLGNVCNLRCIMCSPRSSSRLLTEYVTNRDKFDALGFYRADDVDADFTWPKSQRFQEFAQNLTQARYIKFTGGEPFVNPYLPEVLDRIQNPGSVTLNITTNGTVVNKDLIQILQRFKQIHFTVSIDALDDRYEYIRDGSTWAELERNLSLFQRLDNAIFIVNSVVQFVTAWHLADVVEKINYMGWHFNPIFLVNPPYLSVQSLPPEIKQEAIQRLSECRDAKNQPNVDSVIEFLRNKEYDPLLHQQALRYFGLLDMLRKKNISSVFPELTVI